jgi:predicted dienelactone hydrolase
MRTSLLATVAVAVVVVSLTACAGDGNGEDAANNGDARALPSTTATTSTANEPRPPYDVTTLTRTYIDAGRPTNDPGAVHSAPTRTLPTVIRIPRARGPFPLVVFAHGNSGHPRKPTQLLDAWARAGYVVVAPAFPLTNDDVDPTVIADYPEQATDLSFVIDEVLDENDRTSGALAGKIDASRIGVAGHSLGAASVYGLVANSAVLDERIGAVIALSGIRLDFRGGSYLSTVDTPLLAMHGTADGAIPLDVGRRGYDGWGGPRWFVTLLGAGHAAPYEDDPSPHDALVMDATTLFWNAILRGDAAAAKKFPVATADPTLAALECVTEAGDASTPRTGDECQLVEFEPASGNP